MFLGKVDIPPDARAVLDTSSLLSISEFRVFELAYVNWYGVETDEKTIENHFFPYMYREEVPFFVRAFTRTVLGLEAEGRLEPTEFGIEPRQRTRQGVVHGVLYSVLIGLTITVLLALAKVTAESLEIVDCLFPPCY